MLLFSRFPILDGLPLFSPAGLSPLDGAVTPEPLSPLEGRVDGEPLLLVPLSPLAVVYPSPRMASLGLAFALELPLLGLGV